jgi:hypothetical protein
MMRKSGSMNTPDGGLDGHSPVGRREGYAERLPYNQ